MEITRNPDRVYLLDIWLLERKDAPTVTQWVKDIGCLYHDDSVTLPRLTTQRVRLVLTEPQFEALATSFRLAAITFELVNLQSCLPTDESLPSWYTSLPKEVP